MTIKLPNSTKKVERKNPSPLKNTELDKNRLFWRHDFFALLPSQLRQKRRGQAGLAALQPCMDVARFVSFALMGRFQDGWGACFQLATRWGESEATCLQLDHWQDGLMKWKENGNMNYAQWFDPCLRNPPPKGNGRWRQHLLLLPQSALVDTITDHNKPPGLMTEPHRDVGSVVELRSLKEIVASFGWLEDLPMLVNWLQLFSFFIFFGFSCQLCEFLLAQLANAYRCCSQLFPCIHLSYEDGRPDWTKINIAKSKFSMLKSIEMRHPEHPSCKVQLHPAEEQDLEVTFPLEENEEFVGFQFLEAKQGAQKTYKVKMNSSLFKEVFNKSARVGAMEKRDLPVRSRIRKQEPVSGTIHTFWSALRRRRMWHHCRDISSIPPLRSLGDVVGSLPRQSLPLAQSKETRHRLKLVWKDSVVCWMLAEIHQKVYLP